MGNIFQKIGSIFWPVQPAQPGRILKPTYPAPKPGGPHFKGSFSEAHERARLLVDISSLNMIKPVSIDPQELTVDNLVKKFTFGDLEKAVDHMRFEIGGAFFQRPVSSHAVPGALVLHNGQRTIYVVGDLHGHEVRLDLILEVIGKELCNQEAEIFFLGDLLHTENSQNYANMASSRRMLDAVIMLKTLFPDQVHVFIGNHDVVCSNQWIFNVVYPYDPGKNGGWGEYLPKKLGNRELDQRMATGKGSVPQALEFLRVMCSDLRASGRGKKEIWPIVNSYQEFFDHCPLAAIIQTELEIEKNGGKKGAVYMAHSAVVSGFLTRYQLIEARYNGFMRQLLWNKFTKGDYDVGDIVLTIDGLELRKDASIISAHLVDPNPADGRARWGFIPFPDYMKHMIIHGNVENSFGMLVIKNGQITSRNFNKELRTHPRAAELRAVA